LFVTAAYFLVMLSFSRLSKRLIHIEECVLSVQYVAGEEAIREILKHVPAERSRSTTLRLKMTRRAKQEDMQFGCDCAVVVI
jgi:hypothetical protein